MFFVNYLNRTATDDYRPLFECIYAAELLLIFMYLCCVYPLIFAVLSTKVYHINIRLRIVALLLQIGVCSCARVVVIYHQVYGPVEYVEPEYLLIASVLREAFKGYAVSFVLMLAIDRWIATLAWSWYESHAPSTIMVYITLECLQLLMSWTMSFLLITEIIDDQQFTALLGIILTVAVACYFSVSQYNRRVVEGFKRGAQIQSYSISRCFQFKENVAIMNVLNLIAGPVALSALPCFAFYAVYSNVPSSAGLNFLRYISIALYDLWIIEGSLVLMISLLQSEPKFRHCARKFFATKLMLKRFGLTGDDERTSKIVPQDPNLYFTMLSRDLG